jgi:hypothetical protein
MRPRIHITHEPLTAIHDVPQRPPTERAGGLGKPLGLWYAVGWAWVEWCRSEMPEWAKGVRAYRLTLDRARLLCLVTEYDVLAFGREYGCDPYHMGGRLGTMHIDWPRVAQRYGGVEVAPYHWRLRYGTADDDCMWYYGWDCASGCVWDARVVQRFTEIPLTEEAECPATPNEESA